MQFRSTLHTIAAAASFIAGATFLGSCLRNDIPYPRIQPNILELEVENQAHEPLIDTENRQATVYLTEDADIYNVKIISCSITPDSHFVGDSLKGSVDLSSPQYYIIELYQQYLWTVRAEQTIERYFTVAGQMGETTIDVPARRIIVTLSETADLSRVKVTSVKLGSPSATYDPELLDATIDLSHPYYFDVTDFGRTAQWSIYATITEATVATTSVDAWTNVAWVYGEAEEGRKNTVQYRRADSDQWITVPDSWITDKGGYFYARLVGLESLTTYAARAVSDEEIANEIEFTTGAIEQPNNANFENWWLDGKVWCPWAEGAQPYWGTGNKGAATLGQSNTVPTEDTPTGSGRAARLETRFIGIGSIGKLAAGNIFVGEYVRTDGTNGVLSMGRPFTERPTKLRGYWQYTTAPISHTSAGYEQLKDRPDTCTVWVALIDSDEPLEIRTNPKDRQVFDPNADYVVAYGIAQSGSDIPSYQNFEITLDYRSTSRVPKYLLITASASKYGDYFTGGAGAVLLVDDFELLYDY